MEYFEVNQEKVEEEFLQYLKNVDWGAAKMLKKNLENKMIKEKMGEDTRIFYAKDKENIIGFFTLVNQDYMSLPAYDRFISSIWVDPAYRGRGLVYEFVSHAEKASNIDKIYILSQHKGLYEKMGYKLIDSFTGSIHDREYLYEKSL